MLLWGTNVIHYLKLKVSGRFTILGSSYFAKVQKNIFARMHATYLRVKWLASLLPDLRSNTGRSLKRSSTSRARFAIKGIRFSTIDTPFFDFSNSTYFKLNITNPSCIKANNSYNCSIFFASPEPSLPK